MSTVKLDKIGHWSEVKLCIIQEYAKAFAKVLNKSPYIRRTAYIDGFAGAGAHISKATGKVVDGSPTLALGITPPFNHYHFVEMDAERANGLRQQFNRPDVTVYQGDCNDVLLREVFPKFEYNSFQRALCLLDPYGLNPRWEVIKAAAQTRSIEIFLNFMIMDANMNVLKHNTGNVKPDQAKRMTDFWGDDSWRDAAYTKQPGLFGEMEEKNSNEAVLDAYCKRLRDVAGFKYVPTPIPMKNDQGPTIYYLVFASHNPIGSKIAESIFNKYRKQSAH